MNAISVDFLDFRTHARLGVMRRAVAFSVVLHAVLVVGMGLYWHKRVAGTPVGETAVTIEFTTEAGSSVEPARGVEASAAPSETTVLPAPTVIESVPEPVNETAVAPTTVPETPVVLESATAVEPIVAVASPQLASKSIVSESRFDTSLSPVTNAAVIVMGETVRSDVAARPKAVGDSEAKPGLLAQPLYRKNPEPAYPLAARRRRQEGVVLLAVRVTADGRAAAVTLKQTSAFKLLDDAAAGAVMGWEFEPARTDGRAVESEIEVPVRFRLTK